MIKLLLLLLVPSVVWGGTFTQEIDANIEVSGNGTIQGNLYVSGKVLAYGGVLTPDVRDVLPATEKPKPTTPMLDKAQNARIEALEMTIENVRINYATHNQMRDMVNDIEEEKGVFSFIYGIMLIVSLIIVSFNFSSIIHYLLITLPKHLAESASHWKQFWKVVR